LERGEKKETRSPNRVKERENAGDHKKFSFLLEFVDQPSSEMKKGRKTRYYECGKIRSEEERKTQSSSHPKEGIEKIRPS